MSRRRIDTAWFDDAVRFAVAAHAGQPRKGSDSPYIVHPLRVGLLLQAHRFEQPVVVAGLLHDVVEDCAVTVDEIAGRFGAAVAELVALVTEQKKDGQGWRPWRVRKEEMLARLEGAFTPGAVALKTADSLDNVSSMLRDQAEIGGALWERFTGKPAEQVWYYRSVAERAAARLGRHALVANLEAAVDQLARAVAAISPG